MKIYLAGQITPTPQWFYKWFPRLKARKQALYIQKFYEKATELRRLGHEVFCPPEGEPPNKTWEYYLADDIITGILEYKPEAIYMMKGWRNSNGARLEEEFARQHGMLLIYEK